MAGDDAKFKRCYQRSGVNVLRAACPYDNIYVYLLNGVPSQYGDMASDERFLGSWVEEDTSFLFFSYPADDEVDRLVKAAGSLELIERHVFSYEDWQGGPLECVSIGDFEIVPPWLEHEPRETEMRIVLDPGVVFGNCLHPTTRDCLRALSIVAKDGDLGVVLDLGTGTGVLAVAAALLGADNVTGVDMNPLCVQTARKNVALNEPANVRVVEGDALAYAEKPADLLIANIPYAVTQEMLENEASRSKKRLILSGLMRTQAREIKVRLKKAGYNLIREWDDQMTWHTFLVENQRIEEAYGA